MARNKDKSVAADNPDYPDDAPVIVVAFAEALQTAFPDWEGNTPLPLTAINDSEASHYSFPAPRLTDAESGTPSESTSVGEPPTDSALDASPSDDSDTTTAELSASMRALKERLEAGGMSVETEADGQALQATKLGDTYRVRPGEIIEGDGALRPQLSPLVNCCSLAFPCQTVFTAPVGCSLPGTRGSDRRSDSQAPLRTDDCHHCHHSRWSVNQAAAWSATSSSSPGPSKR